VAEAGRTADPKTLDADFAQLTVGLGWHYQKCTHEQSEEDRERYAFAEVEARARWAAEPSPSGDLAQVKFNGGSFRAPA
jgi:hypothetical protein